MKKPKISVLTSVYNGESYLHESVESILNQTFSDFEFIIVDDGSTDRTLEILSSYDDPRVVLVQNSSNLGLIRSLNRGLKACSAPLIARHDADDLSHKDRLFRQLEFMENHPDVAVLGTQMQVVDEAGRDLYYYELPCSHSLVVWNLFTGRSFAHPSVMIRRHVFDRFGGYDPQYPHVEDFELWIRILGEVRFANLPVAYYFYRDRLDSISHSKAETQRTSALNLRARYAGRVVGREITPQLFSVLDVARDRKNRLSPIEIRATAEMMVELYEKLIRKGFMDEDCPEVTEDLVNSLFPLVKRLKPDEAGKWREAAIKPIHMMQRAVRNPRRAVLALRNRIQNLTAKVLPPVDQEKAQDLIVGPRPGPLPANHSGLTIVVLSYERPMGLVKLLESLSKQHLAHVRLELIVCNNSPRARLTEPRNDNIGSLLSQFDNAKVFDSSYNWRDQVRYSMGVLAQYDTVMFLDDDIELIDPDFIEYMFSQLASLGPVDIVSCWNSLWLDWSNEHITLAPFTFEMQGINQVIETDTIGTGICMFKKSILFTPKILETMRSREKAYDMSFPLVASIEWGSRSYFVPSFGMLRFHEDQLKHSLSYEHGHYAARFSSFQECLKAGYQPVLARSGNSDSAMSIRDRLRSLDLKPYTYKRS